MVNISLLPGRDYSMPTKQEHQKCISGLEITFENIAFLYILTMVSEQLLVESTKHKLKDKWKREAYGDYKHCDFLTALDSDVSAECLAAWHVLSKGTLTLW